MVSSFGKKKIKEIKSDLPFRLWGGFCFAFCEEQLIKMIPNPSENKYRLYAFLAIIARTLIGTMAQFTTIKITGKFLKSYSFVHVTAP